MLKLSLLVVALGIGEILVVSQMHSLLGTFNLVALYIVTTGIGAAILYARRNEIIDGKRAFDRFKSEEFQAIAATEDWDPDDDDIEMLEHLTAMGLYVASVILIVIPGVLSDTVGLFLLIPALKEWYVEAST